MKLHHLNGIKLIFLIIKGAIVSKTLKKLQALQVILNKIWKPW
ncbi:unnamed protein product [Commensalibacter communis]|nr:unnamed protein product [Commensalibacter communis]